MNTTQNITIALILSLTPVLALAHPVTFKGGYAITSWNSEMMGDQSLNYTLSPKIAIQARYLVFRDQNSKQAFTFPQINYLVKRWNEKESQGNLYFSAGYGSERKNTQHSSSGAYSVEADWESRHIYTSGKFQYLSSKNQDLAYARLRYGFAPYLIEFDGLSTWFILQLEHERTYMRDLEVTPLLRFFYKNVLWEVGSSINGSWMLNLMVHF